MATDAEDDALVSAPSEAETSDSDSASVAKEKPLPPGVGLANPLVQEYVPSHLKQGVLIPLKTTLEARQDHTLVQALITRAPTKLASQVVESLRNYLDEGVTKHLAHLRRCAKPTDLPAHLKTQFMNDNAVARQIHTGKSTWLYIVLGEEKKVDRDGVTKMLMDIEGMSENFFMTTVPVPLLAPTCQIQAAMWSSQFWPTVYRKNNPLGPHPSMIARNTDDIKEDASVWMALAHQIALEAQKAGIGEAMGAVVVQRDRGRVDLVGVAGDARWYQEPEPRDPDDTGNPMAHSAMRCISHVAQKLVRHERRAAGKVAVQPVLEYDSFQDAPILPQEKLLFEDEHPTADGYLCHGLELYLTHEPCVQCSMGILHSRMGKVIFCNRMPLTGGLCSEDRGHGHPELEGQGAGRGLGLFWRRELNWSMLAWEWEPAECVKNLPPIDPKIHA